jgi:cell wall-associated NlpC family hydrolase
MSGRILSEEEIATVFSLHNLADEARKSNKPGAKEFASRVDKAASELREKLKATKSSNPDDYPTNLRATMGALKIWRNNPSSYAYTARIEAENGVGTLDPNDRPEANGDYKCNRFVGDAFVKSGAALGYSYDGLGGYRYPTYGRGSIYPVSANDVYDQKNISNMRSITTQFAKMGDIIAFPSADANSSAHIGIYLGNNIYISAHKTEAKDRYGNQVADGIEIGNVPWGKYTEKKPKFRRFKGYAERDKYDEQRTLPRMGSNTNYNPVANSTDINSEAAKNATAATDQSSTKEISTGKHVVITTPSAAQLVARLKQVKAIQQTSSNSVAYQNLINRLKSNSSQELGESTVAQNASAPQTPVKVVRNNGISR